MEKQAAVIVDIDGTLMNIDHRRHFLEKGKKDWKSFNSEMEKDVPNRWCVDLCKCLMFCDYEIIFISGRSEKYRKITEEQISASFCENCTITYPDLHLFMRKEGDFRSDVEIKREIYEKHIKDNYPIFLCIDDNFEIVELWRSMGIVCLDCAAYKRSGSYMDTPVSRDL